MKTSQLKLNKELIEAAFVALYDYVFEDSDLAIPYGLIELVVATIRRSIPLTRAEAQAALRDRAPEGWAGAALVLAYEGVGARGAEAGYAFSLEEALALGEARARIKLSLRRALAILATHHPAS